MRKRKVYRMSGESEAMYMSGLGQGDTLSPYIASPSDSGGSIWDLLSFDTTSQTTDPTQITADQPTSWVDKLTGTVTNLFTAYNQYQNAKQLNDINAQRAAKGLSPISAQQYNASLPASAAVQVNVDPAVKQALTIGGIALGGFLLLKLIKG